MGAKGLKVGRVIGLFSEYGHEGHVGHEIWFDWNVNFMRKAWEEMLRDHVHDCMHVRGYGIR